jgi:hypothetical protein
MITISLIDSIKGLVTGFAGLKMPVKVNQSIFNVIEVTMGDSAADCFAKGMRFTDNSENYLEYIIDPYQLWKVIKSN